MMGLNDASSEIKSEFDEVNNEFDEHKPKRASIYFKELSPVRKNPYSLIRDSLKDLRKAILFL